MVKFERFSSSCPWTATFTSVSSSSLAEKRRLQGIEMGSDLLSSELRKSHICWKVHPCYGEHSQSI